MIRRFFNIERLAFDFKEKFSLFIEFYKNSPIFFKITFSAVFPME